MNTPTKRIFYLFGPKFAKNEPQTKVWGSLTCKPQFSQPVARAFALVARVRAVRAGRGRLRACLRWSCAFAELRSRLRACSRWSYDLRDHRAGGPAGYLTPAFFLARSIAAICSSESLMEP